MYVAEAVVPLLAALLCYTAVLAGQPPRPGRYGSLPYRRPPHGRPPRQFTTGDYTDQCQEYLGRAEQQQQLRGAATTEQSRKGSDRAAENRNTWEQLKNVDGEMTRGQIANGRLMPFGLD